MIIFTSDFMKFALRPLCLCLVVAAIAARADQTADGTADDSDTVLNVAHNDLSDQDDRFAAIEVSDTGVVAPNLTGVPQDTSDGFFEIVFEDLEEAENVYYSDAGHLSRRRPPAGNMYALNVIIDSPGGGMVEGHTPGSAYSPDQRVVLTAIPNAGYEFAGWSSDGEILTDDNFASVVMDGNRTVTAEFIRATARQSAPPAQSSKLTVGPNPAPGGKRSVSLYWNGGEIKSATLSVYDASGALVCRLSIKDPDAGFSRRGYAITGARCIGEWALNDRNLRPVQAGTYLVRGSVMTVDGQRENVSVTIGVS